MNERAIGHLDEVLGNLGVFHTHPDDLIGTCASGFRRVPITAGGEYYISLQGFAPNQIAYAHTHPDSEEWVVVIAGGGEALFSANPVPLEPGSVVGRGAAHPHGFVAGPDGLHMLSIQLPRPAEGATTWDQPGETTHPLDCEYGGSCRRCHRCGGHSKRESGGLYACENCSLEF